MRKRPVERSVHTSVPRRTAGQQLRRRRRFGGAGGRILSQLSPDQGISLHQQKSPTRHLGASGIALSREERGPLRHGRVAWLTAFRPITVAGPRPLCTAFPAFPASKLTDESIPPERECQREFEIVLLRDQRFFQFGLRFSIRARRPSCESSSR